MTAARWAIDDGGGLWWTNDVGWRTMLTATEVSEPAYDALVAAVRDAGTLTRARQLATGLILDEGENGSPVLVYEHADGEACVVGEITCASVIETLTSLLDLLAGHGQ